MKTPRPMWVVGHGHRALPLRRGVTMPTAQMTKLRPLHPGAASWVYPRGDAGTQAQGTVPAQPGPSTGSDHRAKGHGQLKNTAQLPPAGKDPKQSPGVCTPAPSLPTAGLAVTHRAPNPPRGHRQVPWLPTHRCGRRGPDATAEP